MLTDTEMTYDEANRMVTFNGEDVLYDADGNMTYGPVDGQMCELTYDCRNRLIQAGDITYTYDAENVRIGVETDRYTEEYTVDRVSGLTQILEIERTYYYGNGLVYEKDSRDAETDINGNDSSGKSLLVYHYNHLGSTTLITDGEGSPVQRFSYGTYGELLNREDADTTEYGTIRFLYNGQLGVVTDDNGLYYMRARYYNPEIRRFINQDILTGNIGNSASLNRYSYVEGNPVSYTDPFGLSPFDYFTDKINVSSIIHSTLDILGTLPGGGIFDIMNAGYYLLERNYKEAIKSLVFAIPGFDLMKTSSKLAIKGGKLSTATAQVLSTLNAMDMLACVYYAASDFGNDIAYIIYKYGYEKAAFSADTWVELLSLTAHGIQLGHYSNPYMDTDLTPYFEEAMNELNQNGGFINFGSGEGGSGTKLNFRSQESLDSHFTKHGAEFGNITKEQYMQGANNLINSRGDDILTKIRKNGDTIFYNMSTNEFAVKSKIMGWFYKNLF